MGPRVPGAKFGPRSQACRLDATRCYVHQYLVFDGGSCEAFNTRCPQTGPSCNAITTCTQTCPSCAMFHPSWAQVGSARATPNLDPSQLLVGPSRPAFLLSVLFAGCGVLGAKRCEATRITISANRYYIYIYICLYSVCLYILYIYIYHILYIPHKLDSEDNDMDGLCSLCSTYAHQTPWSSTPPSSCRRHTMLPLCTDFFSTQFC